MQILCIAYTGICSYLEQNVDLSIVLCRNEQNHVVKCFTKIIVLILILTQLLAQVYCVADNEATDSENTVHSCCHLEGVGGFRLTFLVVEKGQ